MKIIWIMLITIVGLSTKQLALVVCVLLLLLFADATRDYYEILGVLNSATGRQIKKAFHKLAVKYHPDKNSNPEAEDVFREIAEAYQVLSNNEQRKFYDQHSHEADAKQGGESNSGFGEDQYDDSPVYVWSSPMQDQFGAQQDQGFFDGNYFGFRDSVHDVNEDYSDDWFQDGTEYGFCWLVNTADGSTVKLCEVH